MAFQLKDFVIRVDEYLTQLPPRELLEQKLRSAVELGRERLEPDHPDLIKATTKKHATKRKVVKKASNKNDS